MLSGLRAFFFAQPKPSVEAINTIQEIKEKGKYLGEGGYGCAYKIDNKVYKIYFDNYAKFDEKKEEKTVRLAKRSARYWNDVYKEMYGGKYAYLATAKFITIKDGEKECDVLITPFIEGKPANLTNSSGSDYKKFKQAFGKLRFKMFDYINPGNVIMLASTGDPLPVDCDAFFLRPKRIGYYERVSTHAFFADEEPPSPGTRFLAHRYYKNLYLDYRPR